MTAPVDALAVLRADRGGNYADYQERQAAIAALAELIEAGSLLQRAFAFSPSTDERRALWVALGLVPGISPTIGAIRRAATKRFRAALASAKGGAP